MDEVTVTYVRRLVDDCREYVRLEARPAPRDAWVIAELDAEQLEEHITRCQEALRLLREGESSRR